MRVDAAGAKLESAVKQWTNGSGRSGRVGVEVEKKQLVSANWEQLRTRVRGVRWRRQERDDSTEEADATRSVAPLVTRESRPGSTRSQNN